MLLALLVVAVAPVAAQERILAYHADLALQSDGSLEVTETIRVRAEGERIRRGIFRDFPTRYRDQLGNRVVVDFEVLGLSRDGQPEPFFTERRSNGVRVNTGGDDLLNVPADIEYQLRYRTTRQMGFFGDYDELYWNVTGLGWDFAIESASARLRLPADVAADQWRLAGYTGPEGSTERAVETEIVGPREVVFRSTRSLGPREGLTIAAGFPKGQVPEPSGLARTAAFLSDNGGVLVAMVGFVLLLGFYLLRWHQVGRDLPAGPVFPRYEAPAAFSAGEVRVLRRMEYDNRAFAADVVQMAVRGALDIHAEGKEWRLVRRAEADLAALSPAQQDIQAKLFSTSDEVVLKNTEAKRVGGARLAHTLALTKQLQPAYFKTHGTNVVFAVLASIIWMILAFNVADGNGVLVLVLICALMLGLHVGFGILLRAPTPDGRRAMDEIEGLRRYLSVAERDEIHAAAAPGATPGEPALDAGRYEQLLPYALALDVEAAWSERFTQAVGVQEAQAAQPRWYRGGSAGTAMGLAGLGSSLGSALTQHISSASTPPGGSSGSGGGGSSGGGGGGGGGGGR
ncbi:hypothetical protein GCM10027266_24880 [Arenimonas alkanexedens]